MKSVFVLIISVAFVACVPSGKRNIPRHYIPEEEDPYRIKYLLVEDEDGNIHYENLLDPPHKGPAASKEDVTYHLYTKNNQNVSEVIKATDISSLLQSTYFKSSKNTKFIVHGWNNDGGSNVNVFIKGALLENYDENVFVVDWSRPANKFYTTSKSAVPIVGEILGEFINYILEIYGGSTKNFAIIGHSLGAHVAGCAGTVVKNKHGLLDYIVGLDPAGPLFTVSNTANRIDTSDAQFVHIIHTSAGYLGFASALGHADYYPNGGSSQAGCGFDLFKTCAHSRSYHYFAESIRTKGFVSHMCGDLSSYDEGKCDLNDMSWMGEYKLDETAYGDYFLRTAKKSPYALGTPV